MDPAVVLAMQPYLSDNFYNPSASYLAAKSVAKDISKARLTVAGWLGIRPSEVIFTAGGTEANNLAIRGVMDLYPGANLVVSQIEHESVTKPAKKYDCRQANVLPSGVVDVDIIKKLVTDKTVLVSVIYANNEIGTLQPLRIIAKQLELIRKNRKRRGIKLPLYFHTDACQAGAYLDLHASRLGIDMMTLNGGKIYGPKQSGALYVKAGIVLEPLISGGGQESGLRSGTESVANIVGLAKALDIAQNRRHEESKRMEKLRHLFIDELKTHLPEAIINGSLKHRIPNNIHLTLPGKDNERLMMALDERGIQCAVGSACSASSDESSHVLKAIGLSDEQARASLRFSMGYHTTSANIQKTVRTLAELRPV